MNGERHFRTRFRMSTALFHQIYEALRDRPWWRQQVNATGRPQAYPLQKVFAAIGVLGYWEADDRRDEYPRLSRSTIAVAVHKFVRLIIARFGPNFLRPPNDWSSTRCCDATRRAVCAAALGLSNSHTGNGAPVQRPWRGSFRTARAVRRSCSRRFATRTLTSNTFTLVAPAARTTSTY